MNEAKDVFLSHNRADKPWARELGRRIELEEFSGRRMTVFLDAWDIDPGENFVSRIDEGLAQSRFVALVLSPEMLASDWCRLETTATLATDPMNRKGRLIPLLLKKTTLPPILSVFNYIDFTGDNYEASFLRLRAKIRGERPPRA